MQNKFSVFISFDIEGISGISSWRELKKDSSSLLHAKQRATEEVNAAIRGIKKSRNDIKEIVVCDSHAEGENLVIDRLERGVYLTKGSPRNYYMIEGINEHFNVLFFIGYHAMAGTKGAGMAHTYSSSTIYNIKINGTHVGETEINAAVAGHYGVPLGFVSGDDFLIKEVKEFFGSDIETVITKYGISQFSAKCRHPLDVQQEIERKSEKTVKNIEKLKPFTFNYPVNAEFELVSSLVGDVVESIPELKRISARKLVFEAKNILAFYRVMRLICGLARNMK